MTRMGRGREGFRAGELPFEAVIFAHPRHCQSPMNNLTTIPDCIIMYGKAYILEDA